MKPLHPSLIYPTPTVGDAYTPLYGDFNMDVIVFHICLDTDTVCFFPASGKSRYIGFTFSIEEFKREFIPVKDET